MKRQQIRAVYDKETITVYQAYGKQIAQVAVAKQRFESPFSFQRMTWIKPSFLWMMERSNWGQKSNQEHVLAIKIKRSAWEDALRMAVLTSPDKKVYRSGEEWRTAFKQAKIHVQWDPERNLRGTKLEYRSIQVGVSRFMIEAFVNNWIVSITDMTPQVKKMHQFLKAGKYDHAKRLLPNERLYDLPEDIKKVIGAD